MPIIRVEMFKGRSREQKRALVKEMTEGFLRACGGNPGATAAGRRSWLGAVPRR